MGLSESQEVSLGDIIRHLRVKQGLSARALSLQAGLSPSYVGKLEAGEVTEPSVRAFAQLVSVLQMSPFEVYLSVMMERLRPMSPSTLLSVVPTG